MNTEQGFVFAWPAVSETASIVAVVLALAIFVLASFSGARANKIRVAFSVVISCVIGWLSMPLAIKVAARLHGLDTSTGVMVLVTLMLFYVASIATSIYEIITVSLPDIGLGQRK